MSDVIKVGDTVSYTGQHSMATIDKTKLKVEAVIPSAELLVASGIDEAGNIKCIMSGIGYFSLNKKSEAEKLEDLLESLGKEAFCKVMAETIEKHNELHQHVIANLNQLKASGVQYVTPASVEKYLYDLAQYVGSKLDK